VTVDIQRVTLVIGSQCRSLGPGARLEHAEDSARRLYAILTDPHRGDCSAALPDEESLLIDPTRARMAESIRTAVSNAHDRGAVLVLGFVGHGDAVNGEFHLLASDSVQDRLRAPADRGPYEVVREIGSLLPWAPEVAGLVLVIDACRSGLAAAGAASQWTGRAGTLHRHFATLASTDDLEAWNTSFTRRLTCLLRSGHIARPERFHCVELRDLLAADIQRAAEARSAPLQRPTVTVLHGGGTDPGLWLSKNAAHALEGGSLLAGTSMFEKFRKDFVRYRVTPDLTAVITATTQHRVVAVDGGPGSGKSTLVAGLSRPEVAPGVIPDGLLHGLYLLGAQENSAKVASRLARQLTHTVDGFAEAADRFRAQAADRLRGLDSAELLLLGPLRQLERRAPIRIALDGLDQLSERSTAGVGSLIARLTESRTPPVHIVVTARPGTTIPAPAHRVVLQAASDDTVHAYLHQADVPPAWHGEIAERAQGNWLVAVRLAEIACRRGPWQEGGVLPLDLPETFDHDIEYALDGCEWTAEDAHVRPVLTVLAVAGPGASVPVPLFHRACAHLGTESAAADAAVTNLRSLVVRAVGEDGTERLGLFHQSLKDHLSVNDVYPTQLAAGHEALAAAIDALAPRHHHDPHSPLHQYAESNEPSHLWESGRKAEVPDSLRRRRSAVLRDNVARWVEWCDQFARSLGPADPLTLAARHQIAYWTAESGERSTALDQFRSLLPVRSEQLGPDHPDTLETRHAVARWTGEAGYYTQALALYTSLLADRERIQGTHHPQSIATRGDVAAWTGQTGNPLRAMELFRQLLRDRTQVLGLALDHPMVLGTRGGLAYWTGEAGLWEDALRQAREVLADRLRVSGHDDRDTLSMRFNAAQLTGETGHPRAALALLRELLPDRTRIMGSSHPYTLLTRGAIARWSGECGDPERALAMYRELLSVQERVNIPDHRDTLVTRDAIARWYGETGHPETALALLRELLPIRRRVLGAEHPHTLVTLAGIAWWTAQLGDMDQAGVLLRQLLTARERVLGARHPHTEETRARLRELA
jgi:Tetratricopeptide repeat